MPRYQKVGKSMITPLQLNGCAFDVARLNYAQYSNLDFWQDLVHYMREGFVVSRPTVFGMAKPIERDGRRGWFIQMAVGEIGELLLCLPFPLAFVAFCRNNDDNMRVIEWDYFVEKVGEHYGFKKEAT